jgi:hypothetical protein
MNETFPDEIIYMYTRKQAIEDGEQVDANSGELGRISSAHFKYPVFMTASVYNMIEIAVNNERFANSWTGIWHDILSMSKHHYRTIDESSRSFQVLIRGTGRRSLHILVASVGPMDFDDPRPVVTIMTPEDF